MIDVTALRKKCKLTQRQVANSCDVTPQLISLIENKKISVTPKMAKKLASVFKIRNWKEFL